MPLTDKASMVDVEAMNRVLAGARIKRVLVGLQSGQPTLVVRTDRKMPDTGLDVLLIVTGFIQCGVSGSIIHEATQEIPR